MLAQKNIATMLRLSPVRHLKYRCSLLNFHNAFYFLVDCVTFMDTSYRMMAEWVPQQAVLLAWPHASTDWAPWLESIEQDYLKLVRAISLAATPIILCRDQAHRAHVARQIKGGCVHTPKLVVVPYNDTWCRDYGPICLAHEGHLQLLDFQFRGWGDKYDAALDNDVNRHLSSLWKPPVKTIEFELEGGSIETDGEGTLLTTSRCLLQSNRNPDANRQQVETLLQKTLGVDRVLWLDEGLLIGDDTDSHIDNLARFANTETIVYASCSREDDPHYAPLKAMEEQLRSFRQPDGRYYRLVPVEIPMPQINENGSRLPASYVNFLILNSIVIMPVFGCPYDAEAVKALEKCFPDKRIVTVPGNHLIRQFGGPHCATMQLPVNTVNTLP
jgi:agmatine deiminase